MQSEYLKKILEASNAADRFSADLQAAGYRGEKLKTMVAERMYRGNLVASARSNADALVRRKQRAGEALERRGNELVAALPGPDYPRADLWAKRLEASPGAMQEVQSQLNGKAPMPGEEPLPVSVAQAIAEAPEVFGLQPQHGNLARGYVRRRLIEEDPRAIEWAAELAAAEAELQWARRVFNNLNGILDLEYLEMNKAFAPGWWQRTEAERERWAKADPIGAAFSIAEEGVLPRWIDPFPG